MTDKLITPSRYETAEEYHEKKLKKVSLTFLLDNHKIGLLIILYGRRIIMLVALSFKFGQQPTGGGSYANLSDW